MGRQRIANLDRMFGLTLRPHDTSVLGSNSLTLLCKGLLRIAGFGGESASNSSRQKSEVSLGAAGPGRRDRPQVAREGIVQEPGTHLECHRLADLTCLRLLRPS